MRHDAAHTELSCRRSDVVEPFGPQSVGCREGPVKAAKDPHPGKAGGLVDDCLRPCRGDRDAYGVERVERVEDDGMSAEGVDVLGSFLRAGVTDYLVAGLAKLSDEWGTNRPGRSDDHDSNAAFLLGRNVVRAWHARGWWLGTGLARDRISPRHIRRACGVTHMTPENVRM